MKLKKFKVLSFLLCLALLMGMIPNVVFAIDNTQTVNGYYDDDGVWHQSEDTGPSEITVNDRTSLSLSKTAAPTGNVNEYLITLTAEVTSTASVISAEAAATVLVIDTSGSMDGCASCNSELYDPFFGASYYRHASGCSCGSGRVAEKDSRIYAAKQAALSFLNSFTGNDVSGRYVAIVGFDDLASIKCNWQDITTTEGLANATAAINSLSADGGTNLQQGLDKASSLFASNVVESISKNLRNVVALTDGAPTYYGTRPNGNGQNGSANINNVTTNTATSLKAIINALYTVCYGASNQYCYSGGPTVEAFLKDSIASSADCAFNAESVSDLNSAFENITQTIVEEADNAAGAYVIDPIPSNISASIELDDGKYIWTLGDVEPSISSGIDGVLTYIYTYTTSYTITIDADEQGFDESAFYPANGRTTLVWGDDTFDFPVPGIKGTTSRFSVTYNQGEHGSFGENEEPITYENIKKWSPTVTEERPEPEVNADEGWRFAGWAPQIAENVESDATYTATYEKITHTVTFNANGHGTAPDAQTVDHGQTADKPEDLVVEGWTFLGWYEDLNGDPFDFDTTIKRDYELYAKWTETSVTPVTHTVTFNANGHGTAPDTQTVDHGQTAKDPGRLTASGWTFLGWYTEAACNNKFDFSTPIEKDYELYAKWTRNAVPDDPDDPPVIPDVPPALNGEDHFAYIIGYADGSVHPEANITRAEVATIFFRLLQGDVREANFTRSNSFSDVEEGLWCNNAVSTMAKMGIVNGYSDGTFRPNENITRAEFAAIAARFDENVSSTSANFSDISGHWAAVEIAKAAANDWVNGYSDGTFKPDQKITRAEAMALVNRVLNRDPADPEDLLDDMIKWPDNMDTDKWYYLDVQEATNSHTYERTTKTTEKWLKIEQPRDWAALEQ